VDYPQRQINITWAQPAGLGGPQASHGTEEDR
jgi:hypothetical protein